MKSALHSAVAARLGSEVARAHTVAGGDIHAASKLELVDGRAVFVKAQARPLPGMFRREAEGLGWLAEPRALRVPEVLAFSDGDDGGPAFLALEWIEPGGKSARHDEALGRGLAALHRAGPPSFGLANDNYLATLPQDNRALADWPRFYAERRLSPLIERSARDGTLPASTRRALERVLASMEALSGPSEPPARLHGDLWGGNALCDAQGEPVLIDPAVYGGHREVDLAMMRLFGGFSTRVFAAYDEAFPLLPGHAERVALYQLYPLLAHVCLFGSGYVSQLERCLRAVV